MIQTLVQIASYKNSSFNHLVETTCYEGLNELFWGINVEWVRPDTYDLSQLIVIVVRTKGEKMKTKSERRRKTKLIIYRAISSLVSLLVFTATAYDMLVESKKPNSSSELHGEEMQNSSEASQEETTSTPSSPATLVSERDPIIDPERGKPNFYDIHNATGEINTLKL